MAACIFCKIIKNEIPALKLFESDKTLAFLDIQPLSRGHTLIIPKHHGVKLTDIPDSSLTEILSVAKRVAAATGASDWNLLQNNGRAAHQFVEHVHFHVIPKPTTGKGEGEGGKEEGLGIGWPMTEPGQEVLKGVWEELKSKM